MSTGGFMGKILVVDLTSKTSYEQELDEKIYRQYIGGYGLGVRMLFEHLRPGIDPLGPGNMLGFIAGTFVGTKAHAAGRFNVVGKSPLTGGWGDSSCGGNFGPKLKSTGYDGVFITGKAEKPTYLYLDDGRLEFRDASGIWGKDSSDAETLLKEQIGNKRIGVAAIGQAGENMLKISGIMHDQGRAAARMGLGAVMGSKNLKALVVTGTKKPSIADQEAYEEVLAEMVHSITKEKTGMAKRIGQYGTACVYQNNVAIQDCPVQNWRSVSKGRYSLEQASKLTGDAYEPYKKRKYACAQCPVGCGAILEAVDKDGNKYETHRPEYESIGVFGSLCLIDDVQAVMSANEACNRYGMDTISAGGTIAFAMECFEKGIITLEDTQGVDLSWGNADALLPMLEQMALRKSIGAVLADGSKIAAQKLGKGSEEFAIHTGGVEMAMHDPRCWPGFGYGYVFDPTPGHHCQGTVGFIEHGWVDRQLNEAYDMQHLVEGRYDYQNKGFSLKQLNDWFHFFNGTGMCILGKFAYYRYPMLEMLRAVTGWQDFDMEEALLCGERINTLRHQFNLNEGITYEDFKLPKRAQGIPPFTEGPTAGVTVDMEAVRKDYYAAMDWAYPSGVPAEATLEKLGIHKIVKSKNA